MLLRPEGESQLLFDSEGQGDDVEESAGEEEHLLWVDKYSPRHYTELLSDDVRKKEILKWVRVGSMMIALAD